MAIPRIIFFNVNGSGMGHLNRCLAYARRLQGKAKSYFFSLASAIEIINQMGFEAEYFVSHYWSANSTFAWNSELSVRFGMMLERVCPEVVVFDGTWPYQGFMTACNAYGSPAMVWSNRGLFKAETGTIPVDEALFDLVIHPGELGSSEFDAQVTGGGKKVLVPPVCLLENDELLGKAEARKALGLALDGRYALFSLGPGNLKNVDGIGQGLIRAFQAQQCQVVWARAPISVRDVELPSSVIPISVYPLAYYLRAFDVFVGASGYNTCCEVVQAGIPALFVPNEQLVDDQRRRAQMAANIIPAVVSTCETDCQRGAAVEALFKMMTNNEFSRPAISMNGANLAADEILALISGRRLY